ncbi:MAG: D-tyrosyl-tRNA(Tyr) deacylase [Paraglaciecola sp.]|jgi:D-tyrosyl-tRNA(Tyr) deacylase
MIGVIQRVSQAQVKVDSRLVGEIQHGILVLLGIEKDDDESKVIKLAEKILNLRIFADEQGKMNLNIRQAQGQLLVVSQFTLAADTSKGNRPGFSSAASAELGLLMYQQFIHYVRQNGLHCETGEYAANMQVSLINDGPVTFHLKV